MRLLAPALAAASLAFALQVAAPPLRAADAPTPNVTIRPQPLAATADFKWVFGIQLNNPLDVGLYPDSILGVAEDLDPGRTDGPRRQEIPLSHFRRLFTPLSAGATQGLHYTGNAYFEHARVTFTVFSHLASGKPLKIQNTFEVMPGPSSREYPSDSLAIRTGRIEIVRMKRLLPPDGRPVPGVLVVHGAASHARRQLVFGREAAQAGYHVVLVSLPGYGLSSGQPDAMGPASLEAVERAFDQLRAMPDVDTTKLAVWGVGEGAGLAARLAARRSDVAAVVLQGGVYDLWAAARARGRNGPAEVARAAGRDSTAWRDRSALLSATRIAAPVLMLHTTRDAAAPMAQAQAYAAALQASGTQVTLTEMEGADVPRPIGITADTGLGFLGRTFHFP